MHSLKIHFSLMSAGILSFFPLSAQAQLVINSTQNAAINGDNNQITQVINQTIIYQRNPRSPHAENMNRGQDDNDRRGRNNSHHDDDHGRRRYREGQKNNRD
jgi:hypothetical protein